ncbi:MAG: BamA/TamA family outer membrane protein [Weeksellaceae bacterium]|nr:BamA/TamA family outer membrane protein [Weeksellaceae bacterium]
MWLLSACSITDKIPDHEYVLKKNQYEFEGEREFRRELESYVYQRPNSRLFGFIPNREWAYNQVPAELDTVFADYYGYNLQDRNRALLDSLLVLYGQEEYLGRSLWLRRQFYRWGARPVTWNESESVASAENLERFYFDRGYFDAEVTPTYDLDTVAQTAQVTYNIEIHDPSFIASYDQAITDSNLERIYAEKSDKSLIEPGQRFDVQKFNDERARLVRDFQNNGYYRFNDHGTDIIFRVDSTDSKQLPVTLRIAKEATDTVRNFQQYYFGPVQIYTDNNLRDTAYQAQNRGYQLYASRPFRFHPRVFTDAVVINPGSLYNLRDIADTRRLIFDRENFTMTGMEIIPNPANPQDSILHTSITLRPKEKFDLELAFEGSYSQLLNFGISPGLRLLTRNIFGGGENLQFNLRGTLGTVNNADINTNFFNAYELSFETRLTLPRLMLPPFDTEGWIPKRWNPKSSASLGLSGQRNIALGSRNYSGILDFAISPGITTHTIEPFNLQYIRNTEKDRYFRIFTLDNAVRQNTFEQYFLFNPLAEEMYLSGELPADALEEMIYNDVEFVDNLPFQNYTYEDFANYRNIIFRKQNITQDVLIQAFSHSFSYDENKRYENVRNPLVIYTRAEVAGALLRLLDNTIGFEQQTDITGETYSTIGGVPYSEYIKLDVDVRKTFNLTPNTSIALRSFTGVAFPFGNWKFLPFTKAYFGGGSNDVRAWRAFALSPAPLSTDDRGTYIDQMKLTWNAEYRFPIQGFFNGALFVDAGNIWSLDPDNTRTLFRWNEFYKQIAVGSGFGLRLDFTFVIARIDFAYKIHNPAYSDGGWFRDINIFRPQIQLGINHPF